MEPRLVSDPAGWPAAVKAAVEESPPAVLLGGGDGSFSRGLAPLVGSGVAVGFVPLGTGNGIARSFGMGSPEDACRAVAAGRTILAGAGRANGHYFLNMASAGISVDVTRGVNRGLKQAAGLAAYPISIARAVLRRRAFALSLATPGEKVTFSAVQVIVFVGRYISRWPGPGVIQPGTGLQICILPALALPRLGLTAAAFWLGLTHKAGRPGCTVPGKIICREAATATIEADPRLQVNIDGEIITPTPLQVAWIGKGVRVYVRDNA